MSAAWERLAHHPRLPWLLGLLAVVLTLPALATGFQFDDFRLRATMRGPAGPAPLSVALSRAFVFMDGNPAHTQAQMASGVLPWWSLPDGQVAFWRPLTALTHWLDFALWPSSPALMHLHSLLWLGLLVAAAAGLYRRVALAPPVAALAGLLFTIDQTHGFAAAWLSNRNILIAALFGVLALSAHLRWRRAGWRLGAVLAPLLLWLALLSAEAAVAVLAYWLAATVFLENGGWRTRLLALIPAGAVTLAWLLVHSALGYGLWGTSYLDPLREPLPFAQALVERLPLLLMGQWLLPPAEYVTFLGPALARAVWVAALVVMALLAWAMMPLLRRSGTARFWGAGMLLAAVPACAAPPNDRLLFFVGLGAMGLLAEFLLASLRALSRARTVWLTSAVTGLLLAVHLTVSPLLLPVMAFSPKLFGGVPHGLEDLIASLPADPALAGQTVVIAYAPNFSDAGYIGLLRPALGLPAPARVLALSNGLGPVTLLRRDANTLVVTPSGGFITGYDSVFRGPAHPLAPGQVVDLGQVKVTVLALTADGRPATVGYQFATPLDATRLRWFQWRAGAYVPFALPAIGAAVQVP